MNLEANPWVGVAVLMAAGLAGFGFLFWRGFLRADAFAHAPPRRVEFTCFDLLMAIGVLFLGANIAQLAAKGMGVSAPPSATQPASAPSASSQPDSTQPALTQPGTTPTGSSRDLRNLAITQLLMQLCSEGSVLFYVFIRARMTPRGLRELGVIPARPMADVTFGLLVALAATPLVLGIIQVTVNVGIILGKPAPVISHTMLEAMHNADSALTQSLLLISAVLVAPLLEEVMFRGLLQTVLVGLLGRDRRWPAVVTASVFFAAVHLGAAEWQTLPGLFILGLILGWLYERSGSLLASITLHAAFNALNVGLLFLLPSPP